MLTHHPDTIKLFEKNGLKFNISFSGHSHGGQLCFPCSNYYPFLQFIQNWIFCCVPNCMIPKPINRMVKMVDWNLKGLVQRDTDSYLYVSRGLGTHAPMRLFCPPEISIFQVDSKNKSNWENLQSDWRKRREYKKRNWSKWTVHYW